jgi:acetone carboxylase gamma subunit
MTKRMGEYLVIDDVSGKPMVRCRKCEYVFCSPKENYKNYCLVSENPLTKAGPQYAKTERFILREFYCPKCATMLDVEMCLKDSPFVFDAQLRI